MYHIEKGMKVFIGERVFDVLDVKHSDSGYKYVSVGPVTPEATEYVRSIYGGSGISTKHQEDREGWRRRQGYHIYIFESIASKLKTVEENKHLASILERYDD